MANNDLVLWIDLETNHNDVLSNKILEIFIQYASGFSCNSEPISEFYSLVVPEGTQTSSHEEFIQSLELSTWCSDVFKVNGLLTDLYDADTKNTIDNVKQNLDRWLAYLVDTANAKCFVFAGKNIHYDMTVINRVFGDVLKKYPIAKHTYDISTLYYIHRANGGKDISVIPSTIHRAYSDVISTRNMNSVLLEIYFLHPKCGKNRLVDII